MARVPSVLSGQLSQFVRRARENEFELQTVGGTRLENQIQALFGGVQVRNLPQPLQQIIAQDRALGGGGGSGPLTLINPFTNDELTPDQQKAAANQMAVQQGANPPFPEVQQPQGQNSVTEAARQSASGQQAAVAAGHISPRDAQSNTRAVVLNATLDNDAQRAAAADIKALTSQKKDFTFQQIAKLELRIEKDHPSANLDVIQGWRDIKGTNEEWAARVQEAIKAHSAKWPTLPDNAFSYNERINRIVLDDEWQRTNEIVERGEERAAKPVQNANQFAAKQAATIRDSDMAALNKEFQAGARDDPRAASNRFNAGRITVTQTYLDTLKALRAPGGVAAQPAPQPTAQPQAPPAPAVIPGLPAGVAMFGTYNTALDAKAANPPTGSYILIGGGAFRRRADGQLEAVVLSSGGAGVGFSGGGF